MTTTTMEGNRINPNKNIKDADDYIGYANEIFEKFLLGFNVGNGLLKYINEGDLAEPEWTFIYTTRGSKLADRMRSRLTKLGYKLFPNDDIEIESYLYNEG